LPPDDAPALSPDDSVLPPDVPVSPPPPPPPQAVAKDNIKINATTTIKIFFILHLHTFISYIFLSFNKKLKYQFQLPSC